MPTWLKVTLNILLNVVLVVCAVLFTIYTDVFDKYKKYTYEDLQDAYNTGYAQASAVVADLQAKINELTESLSQKLQQVSDLQLQINDLQNKNSELETEKQDLEQQILELQNLVSQKDSEIANLEAEIERLKSELEIYANQELDLVYVTFYVDNEVYKTVSVRKEGSILVDIEDYQKDGYVFANWTDGENIVDLTSYTFNANTDIYADFLKKYTISFYIADLNNNDLELYETQTVTNVEQIVIPTPDPVDCYYFMGWRIGTEKLDLSTLELTSDISVIGSWDIFHFEGAYNASIIKVVGTGSGINITYTIEFDFNIESGAVKSISITGTESYRNHNCNITVDRYYLS